MVGWRFSDVGLLSLDVGFFSLDVGFFSPPTGNQPRPLLAGLVFEEFDTNLRKFLKVLPLKVRGQRCVLGSVASALELLHANGLVHADVKSANILLRGYRPGGGACLRWRCMYEAASASTASSSISQWDDLYLSGCLEVFFAKVCSNRPTINKSLSAYENASIY